jgi:hypothetical protein
MQGYDTGLRARAEQNKDQDEGRGRIRTDTAAQGAEGVSAIGPASKPKPRRSKSVPKLAITR